MRRESRHNRNEMRHPKKCHFCVNKNVEIDYKDVATLSKYLNRWAKIDSRERNGNCAKHQRWMVAAIKRARFLALLPYISR